MQIHLRGYEATDPRIKPAAGFGIDLADPNKWGDESDARIVGNEVTSGNEEGGLKAMEALLANAETRAVVEKHLPGIGDHPARPQFENMTLAQVAPMSQGAITPEIIAAIDEDLKKLPAA